MTNCFLILIVLIGVALSQVQSDYEGSGSAESEDEYNYTYDYDDEYGSGEAELDYEIPEMLSRPLAIEAKTGDRVEFPCAAENASEFVRIWMRGDNDVLFTGGVRGPKTPARFRIEASALILDGATLDDDDGRFTCRLMVRGEIVLTHTLSVTQAFDVKPIEDTVIVNEGDTASLGCRVLGQESEDEDEFEWRRDGFPFADGTHEFEGARVVIEEARQSDAGRYLCTATSRNGKTNCDVFAPTCHGEEKKFTRVRLFSVFPCSRKAGKG